MDTRRVRAGRTFGPTGTVVALLAAGVVAACADGADGADDAQARAPRPVSESIDAMQASQAAASGSEGVAISTADVMTVWKSPTCGCCGDWVEHMRAAGFEVVTHDVDDLSAVKAEHGVLPQHQSCHTAVVGDYVVEGHVPADLVRKMLDEQPEIAGLAVPGMPRGSPGMEMPDGAKDDYDVIAFTSDGAAEVYARR